MIQCQSVCVLATHALSYGERQDYRVTCPAERDFTATVSRHIVLFLSFYFSYITKEYFGCKAKIEKGGLRVHGSMIC